MDRNLCGFDRNIDNMYVFFYVIMFLYKKIYTHTDISIFIYKRNYINKHKVKK